MMSLVPGVLLQLLVGSQAFAPAVRTEMPFDTTLAAPRFASVALDLRAGGALVVVGGESRIVRVHVTDRGHRCADCVVSVIHTAGGVRVSTSRSVSAGVPADLLVELEVPTQTSIALTSAGGDVDVEGIDGTLSGTTAFGALRLRRLSGAVQLETKHGDVALRESYVSGQLRTGAGRMLLEDVAGGVDAISANGRVTERRVEHTPSAP
jgi:DUF4097 and DUF4098 domain-containing protein YvlB